MTHFVLVLSLLSAVSAIVLRGSKSDILGPAPSAKTTELTEWVFPESAEPSGIARVNGTHMLVVSDDGTLYTVAQDN